MEQLQLPLGKVQLKPSGMMARNMLFIFYKELKRALTPIQVTPQQAI
ncbi:hypothetical protein C427_0887 [Paraglaciecola psychrophila 170]|uniref:Uncharacterized protein n=1 Tax=Paraglaciecola psychrophila 170 TaxID=1129794 RepID=K7A9Q1_9ALTE|nr:hypothetical protein C427_0887 [Paraglaciecola psychrophila 170]GAC39027.1 hypothetical protein GPSY_3416 [Paraglaciecola psychrophila 170]